MIDKKHIVQLIEERIAGTDAFIVSVSISSSNDIHVVLDADNGITIDRCISVSRNIEHNLDRESNDFSLEVGSFVLGHPFQMLRQYLKYVGKKVSVVLNDGTNLKGTMTAVDENQLILEQELTKKKIKEGVQASIKIQMIDIKETKAMIVF